MSRMTDYLAEISFNHNFFRYLYKNTCLYTYSLSGFHRNAIRNVGQDAIKTVPIMRMRARRDLAHNLSSHPFLSSFFWPFSPVEAYSMYMYTS